MERILIIGPAWVGDMVMAGSLVAALLREHRGARVDMAAPEWSAPICARMPGISSVRLTDFDHDRFDLPKRIAFGRSLRKDKYDLAVVLPNSWKSAIPPYAAGIPIRRGFLGEMRYGLLNDIRSLDKEILPRTVDRFMALAGNAGFQPPADGAWPILESSETSGRDAADRFGLSKETRPAVALCPGADYGPAKQWPAQHFAAAARRLVRLGFAVWILGSPKHAGLGADIAAMAASAGPAANPVNLCGATSLLEAIDLMGLTTAVLSNDSGLMHIAAALRKPIVAIFGSSTPKMTPPLAAEVRILERSLPCRPCFERVCPLQHTNCLQLVAPDEAVNALLELLKDPALAASR